MICCAGEACVGKGLQRVGDAGVLGEARAVVVYMAAVLLSGKTNGLGIASSLDVKTRASRRRSDRAGVGAEGRLACARQVDEDRHAAV